MLHLKCKAVYNYVVTEIARIRWLFLKSVMSLMLFTFKILSYTHALGGISGVASFITIDEQLQ